MEQQSAEDMWCLLNGHGLALAAISGVDWNRELPLQSAPKVLRNGENFGSQGLTLLNILIRQIVPLTEEQLDHAPKFCGITGYSFTGLFVLWSVYQTDLFDRALLPFAHSGFTECGVIRDGIIQLESAKPTVGNIKPNFLYKLPF